MGEKYLNEFFARKFIPVADLLHFAKRIFSWKASCN